MTVSLIILAALVGVGAILYVHDRLTASGHDADVSDADVSDADATGPDSTADSTQCCGMHITCEKDSLLAAVSPEIVYYDDDELDAYRGRSASGYTDQEIEQFRDVLLSLLPSDIAGWARSLQLRGITLPAEVRDELLLIVSEARARSAS